MQQFETRYGRVVSFDLRSFYGEIHLDTAPEQELRFHATYHYSRRPTRSPFVGEFVEVVRDAYTKAVMSVREVTEEAYKTALAEDRAKLGTYTKARLDEALDLIGRLKKEHEAQAAAASTTWRRISDLQMQVKQLCQHDEQIFERKWPLQDTLGNYWGTKYFYKCAICDGVLASYSADKESMLDLKDSKEREKAMRWQAEGRIIELREKD